MGNDEQNPDPADGASERIQPLRRKRSRRASYFVTDSRTSLKNEDEKQTDGSQTSSSSRLHHRKSAKASASSTNDEQNPDPADGASERIQPLRRQRSRRASYLVPDSRTSLKNEDEKQTDGS